MALWSNTDANTSAPKFAVAGGLGVSANGQTLYANTTTSGYVSGAKVGVFGIDVVEQGLANNKTTRGAHSGWNLVTQGTGGRAGRIHTQTLVAMGSMLATTDGGPVANDDTTFADA
jgi:hypothetical protein